MVTLSSTITCPQCGGRQTEVMPTDACQFFYDCKHCGRVLRPKSGDCCVFCSYGDAPCPPMQASRDDVAGCGTRRGTGQ
ncbi:MAG TPA: GDCCVxC domain-containing (seleno)protein [Stellaceae bacterium]|nr:GDCCVxC domain-containing (seleno)protein [Stellaceae bacterium]